MYADRESLSGGESATLICSILSINGPSREQFRWEKSSLTVANYTDSVGSSLIVSTADISNSFGEYGCIVSNGIYDYKETVLISEKGIYLNKVANDIMVFLDHTVDIKYYLMPLEDSHCVSEMFVVCCCCCCCCCCCY